MGKGYFNKAVCLVCGHQDRVNHPSKEEYQEVTVCPKCNGTFVDVWKLGKYEKHFNQHKACEHKYQVVSNETTSLYSDDKQLDKVISVVFYCENCLDIQTKEKRIRKGEQVNGCI